MNVDLDNIPANLVLKENLYFYVGGNVLSFQLSVSAATILNLRITENEDYRILENGEFRLLED